MSEIKYYDGGCKDIIMSIPTNTIEMTVNLKLYENGEVIDAEQVFDLNEIKDAEDLFKQCCDGEYPRYTLTEKGREYVEKLRRERMIDDGEDD